MKEPDNWSATSVGSAATTGVGGLAGSTRKSVSGLVATDAGLTSCGATSIVSESSDCEEWYISGCSDDASIVSEDEDEDPCKHRSRKTCILWVW